MNYIVALEILHRTLKPRNYLEIGCQYGNSLTLSQCPSIGVDPDFQISAQIAAATRLFRMTSDEFFAQPSVRDLVGGSIDLAFIDGMHLAEFAIRDFANIERLATERTVVAFDDVLPPNLESASRERKSKVWTGDIYRAILALKEVRPDLHIRVYDVEQKGICIVSKLNPSSKFQTLIPDVEQRLANGEWVRASAAEIREDVAARSVEKLEPDMQDLAKSFKSQDSVPIDELGAAILHDLARINPGPLIADISARVDLLASERDRVAKDLADTRSLTTGYAASVAALEEAMAGQREQTRELRRALRQSERGRQAILDSASWRLTKPYRMGRHVAGRIYHALYGPKLLRGEDPPQTLSGPLASPLVAQDSFIRDETADADTIRHSGLFDEQYYRSAFYGDIRDDENPVSHYCRSGWKSQTAPTKWFNPTAYLSANPTVKTARSNPLAHYIRSLAQYRTDREGLPTESWAGRIAVYTAISGGYDELNEPIRFSDGVDFFAFSDRPLANGSVWKRLEFDYLHQDPSRTSRFVKINPHLYFPDYEWSIWVDANLGLNEDPRSLIEGMIQGADMGAFSHPLRSCIYDEAEECSRRKKDSDIEIREQVLRYRKSGHPLKTGLFESGVLVRQHRRQSVSKAMKDWWREIDNGSRRDQISLPFIIRENNIKVDILARTGICVRSDHRIVYHDHIKTGGI